jgi:cytochrome c-type biogenesis protein CcmH/NrfF
MKTVCIAHTLRRMALRGSFAALMSFGGLSLAPTLVRADSPPTEAAPSSASSPSAAAAPTSTLPPEEVERQAEAIARSIMSPFCPGRTVSACPVAGPWRDDIRKWVGEGVDAEEIKRRFAERAPEHNLMGVPKNRLGWALPIGLGVLAFGILVFLLRYLVGPRADGGAPSAETKSAETKSAETKPAKTKPAETKPAQAKSTDTAPRAKANANSAVASRANGEDYDARLEQELDRLDQ